MTLNNPTSLENIEDSLDDLNREMPIAIYSLGRQDVLLFLRNLTRNLINKLSELNKLKNSLLDNHKLLLERLEKRQAAPELKNKLVEMLHINEHMLVNVSSVQQQLMNTQKYNEWLWLQMTMYYESLDEVLSEDLTIEKQANEKKLELKFAKGHDLENQAHQARCYPLYSALHPAPYKRTPFG